MYWDANRIGWNVHLEFWKPFQWSFYRDVFFFGTLSEVLGRIITILTLVPSFTLAGWAWRTRARDPMRLAVALLNLGLFFETVIGSHGMHSMVRYLVPIHALVIPLGAAWMQERMAERDAVGAPLVSFRLVAASLATAAFLLAVQVLFAIRHSRNEWVS